MWRVVNVLDSAAFDNEKLTPGLNFINILRTTFTHVDPACAKKDSQVNIVILRFWALPE